jgi:hypothetical protein
MPALSNFIQHIREIRKKKELMGILLGRIKSNYILVCRQHDPIYKKILITPIKNCEN